MEDPRIYDLYHTGIVCWIAYCEKPYLLELLALKLNLDYDHPALFEDEHEALLENRTEDQQRAIGYYTAEGLNERFGNDDAKDEMEKLQFQSWERMEKNDPVATSMGTDFVIRFAATFNSKLLGKMEADTLTRFDLTQELKQFIIVAKMHPALGFTSDDIATIFTQQGANGPEDKSISPREILWFLAKIYVETRTGDDDPSLLDYFSDFDDDDTVATVALHMTQILEEARDAASPAGHSLGSSEMEISSGPDPASEGE